jgi:hypothetical protein
LATDRHAEQSPVGACRLPALDSSSRELSREIDKVHSALAEVLWQKCFARGTSAEVLRRCAALVEFSGAAENIMRVYVVEKLHTCAAGKTHEG